MTGTGPLTDAARDRRAAADPADLSPRERGALRARRRRMTGKDRAVVDRLLGIRERPAVDRPDDKDRR